MKTTKQVMKRVFTHYVQMDTYEVPEDVCNKGDEAIEEHIFGEESKLVKSDSRDFGIVDVEDL